MKDRKCGEEGQENEVKLGRNEDDYDWEREKDEGQNSKSTKERKIKERKNREVQEEGFKRGEERRGR